MTPAHEYAEIFPLHEGAPLYELSDRIKANGLREPIVLLGGKVLDGRRREIACKRANVPPAYRDFGSIPTDGEDPLEFVVDINLHRRHMGEGDRKLAAAKYATAKRGRPEKQSTGKVAVKTSQVETFPAPTNAEAAERFDVSEQDVDRAKVVIANGTPAVQAALAADTITVSDAAKVSIEPPEVQDAAVQAVADGEARSATGAVKKKRNRKPKKTLSEESEEARAKDVADAENTEEPTIEQRVKIQSRALESWCRQVMSLAKQLPENDAWLNEMDRRGSAIKKLQNACETVRSAKCTAVCPKCEGMGCESCHSSGMVTHYALGQIGSK